MRYLLIILFFLSGYVGVSQTRPTGFPTQKSTGWFEQGYQQSDSATIIATRDTNFLPRFCGTIILWPHVAVDTSYWFWNCAKWIKILQTGNASTVKANQGLTVNGDTVQLGQRLTDLSGSSNVTEYRFIRMLDSAGGSVPQIFFGNKPIASYGLTNSSNHGGVPTYMSMFREVIIPDSSQNFQYNGIFNTLTGIYPDSNTTFWSVGNPLTMGVNGIYNTARFRAPKNSAIFSGGFGNSFSSFRSAMDFGYFNAYNLNITSSAAIPNFPINSYESSIDFDRATNNAQRVITGSPVTGFVTTWRSYQQNITGGTANLGSSIGKVSGFVAYGSLYTHSESPSKAKTLLVSKMDTVVGFWAYPQYGVLNEAVSGFGFLSTGTLDLNYFAGKHRVGGTMPLFGQMTARFEVRDTSTLLTAASIMSMVTDSSKTFNTTGGVITNEMSSFYSVATRASGANSLTNISLHARAVNGQDNIALFIDSGDFRSGSSGNFSARVQGVHNYTVSSAQLATIPVYESYMQKDVTYSSNGNQTPTASVGAHVFNVHRTGDSLTLSNDEISASRVVLAIRKRSGFSGRTFVVGGLSPSIGINMPPSAAISVVDFSQSSLSGANSITGLGYWSAFTPMFRMNAFDTVKNAIWLNVNGGQLNAGRIDTAYGIYLNTFPVGATIGLKYAIYQAGSTDSIILNSAGIRTPNMPQVSDTTTNKPLVWNTATGLLSRMNRWPITSSGSAGGSAYGIDSTVISGTANSVLFVSATGKLAQDNAAFNYVDGNNALYVDSVRSLRVQSPLFLGGTATTSSITYKTTTGTGTTGADHIWQVGTNGATEAMRILNSGNVGIGTSAPEMKLHVQGTGAGAGFVNTASPSSSSGSGITAWVFGNPTAADQRLGYYSFGSKNSTTTQNYGAFISAYSGAAWTSGSSMPTYMSFFTVPSGSGTAVERMRINPAGELQINNTTDAGAFTLQNTGGFINTGPVRWDLGSDATGDMYYRNATPTVTRLAAGADSTVIRYIGGVPTVGPLVTSSTYVAALTGTANVSASTFSDAYYIRVGNIVTVNLVILIDPTVALTQTNLEISLPIASNFATGSDCSGQIITNDSGDQTYGVVFSSIANDRAVVSFVAGATASNATFRVHFSYKII